MRGSDRQTAYPTLGVGHVWQISVRLSRARSESSSGVSGCGWTARPNRLLRSPSLAACAARTGKRARRDSTPQPLTPLAKPRCVRGSDWQTDPLPRFLAGEPAAGCRHHAVCSAAAGCKPNSSTASLAHAELLHLARHRHRERVHELPVARHLVRRDLAAAERASAPRPSRRRRVRGRDPGHHLLAVLRARHADHLRLAHAGVACAGTPRSRAARCSRRRG